MAKALMAKAAAWKIIGWRRRRNNSEIGDSAAKISLKHGKRRKWRRTAAMASGGFSKAENKAHKAQSENQWRHGENLAKANEMAAALKWRRRQRRRKAAKTGGGGAWRSGGGAGKRSWALAAGRARMALRRWRRKAWQSEAGGSLAGVLAAAWRAEMAACWRHVAANGVMAYVGKGISSAIGGVHRKKAQLCESQKAGGMAQASTGSNSHHKQRIMENCSGVSLFHAEKLICIGMRRAAKTWRRESSVTSASKRRALSYQQKRRGGSMRCTAAERKRAIGGRACGVSERRLQASAAEKGAMASSLSEEREKLLR